MVYLDAVIPPIRPEDFIALLRLSFTTACDATDKPYAELEGYEKTFVGGYFQGFLRRQFGIKNPVKFTLNDQWTIPPSCYGKHTLLARGDVENQVCSLEMAFITEDMFPGKKKHFLSQKKLRSLDISQIIVPDTKLVI